MPQNHARENETGETSGCCGRDTKTASTIKSDAAAAAEISSSSPMSFMCEGKFGWINRIPNRVPDKSTYVYFFLFERYAQLFRCTVITRLTAVFEIQNLSNWFNTRIKQSILYVLFFERILKLYVACNDLYRVFDEQRKMSFFLKYIFVEVQYPCVRTKTARHPLEESSTSLDSSRTVSNLHKASGRIWCITHDNPEPRLPGRRIWNRRPKLGRD